MILHRHPPRARVEKCPTIIQTLRIRVDDDDDDDAALLLLLLGFYFRLKQHYVYFNAQTSNAHPPTPTHHENETRARANPCSWN